MEAISQYKDIIQIFGQEDCPISRILLELSIISPDINWQKIAIIFKITFDSYMEKDDRVDFSLKNVLNIKHYSTYVFRNLYKIIDGDSFLNIEIRNIKFLNSLLNIKKTIVSQLKKNYSSHILQDKFEIISEFIDLVQRKIDEDKTIQNFA